MTRGLNEFWSHPKPYSSGLEFRGICKDVIDGDTYTILVDLGFYIYTNIRVRLNGVDTPELRGGTEAQQARGIEAQYFVQDLILNKPVVIRTYRDKKSFDRWIADVSFYIRDTNGNLEETDLGTAIMNKGLIK